MFKWKKFRRSREFRKNNQIIDFEKAREARKEKRMALAKNTYETEKAEPSRRKVIQRNRKLFFYTAIMMFIIALGVASVYQIFSVENDLEKALANREALEAEKARLEFQLQNVHSPEFVEQQARATLRMIMPGEIYFIVPLDNDEE